MTTSMRRAIHGFADSLAVFSSGVEGELLDLRRNVDNQPTTGATCFRHCLEDLDDRLAAMTEEMEALEAVTTDAISLQVRAAPALRLGQQVLPCSDEPRLSPRAPTRRVAPTQELVYLCNAAYTQNHRAIGGLEAHLASYGYTEAYAPAPPEDPRALLGSSHHQAAAMVALAAAPDCGGGAAAEPGNEGGEGEEHEYGEGQENQGPRAPPEAHPPGECPVSQPASAKATLGCAPSSFPSPCADSGGGARGAKRAGTAQRPVAAGALAAMAPMTAAKALAARRDTVSSLASSPGLMSPSMR